MLKTKKRNIFDNLKQDLEGVMEQDGGFPGFGTKKKEENAANAANPANKVNKPKGSSLFGKLFGTNCNDYNKDETKCKSKKKCKWEDSTCIEKSKEEIKQAKKDKKLGKKSIEEEKDEKSKFKNSQLYNTNVMCYYKFISRKKYPKDAAKLELRLTPESSKITFELPKHNDGWIRNFWHIFISHKSWIRVFDRFEQRYTGKTEDEFGENSDKEGNLYEVYLDFGKNMNVAYRQFMEFIVRMHAGRDDLEPEQAIQKFFDNIRNESIGLEYYINRAKTKYIQDYKLEKSNVYNTGDRSFLLQAERDRKLKKKEQFYNPQEETKPLSGERIVDRTVGTEKYAQQQTFVKEKKKEESGAEKLMTTKITKLNQDVQKLNTDLLNNEYKLKYAQISSNLNGVINSAKEYIKGKSNADTLKSTIQDLEQYLDSTQITKKVSDLKTKFKAFVEAYGKFKTESQAGGDNIGNMSMVTTGAQGLTSGNYAGDISDKVFQGSYGRDQAFAASRTPAISLLKSERPDDDFFDEAAKELQIDKSFISQQLTPQQIAEYRIIRSKGNLKYVTPIDYFRWATGDTMRLQDDLRYAKYNIRVINKIMKSFHGFCLSNLVFNLGDNKNPTSKEISDGYGGIVIKMRSDSQSGESPYDFTIDKLGSEIRDEIEIINDHNKKMGDKADIDDISIEKDIFRENQYRFKRALEEKAGLTSEGVSVQYKSCTKPKPAKYHGGGRITKKYRNYSKLHNNHLNKIRSNKIKEQDGGWAEGAAYRFRVTLEGHFLSRDMFVLPPIMFTKNKLRCGENILGEKSSAYFGSDCQKNPIKLFSKKDIDNKNYVCSDYRNPNIKIDHFGRYLGVKLSQIARKRTRKSCFRKDMIESLKKGVNKYRYWGFQKGQDYFYRYDFSAGGEREHKVAIFLPDGIRDLIIKDRNQPSAVSRTPPLLKVKDADKSCNDGKGYFQLKNLTPLQNEIFSGDKHVHAYLLEPITKGDRQFVRLDFNDILVKATEEELKSRNLQQTILNYVNRQLQILTIADADKDDTSSFGTKMVDLKTQYIAIKKSIEVSGDSFVQSWEKNIFFLEKKLKYIRLYLHNVRSTVFEKNAVENWHALDHTSVLSSNNRLMLFMDDYFEHTLFTESITESTKLNFIKTFVEKIKELEKEIAEGDNKSKLRVDQRRDRAKTTEKLRQDQIDARSTMSSLDKERDRERFKDYRPGFGMGMGMGNMGVDIGS